MTKINITLDVSKINKSKIVDRTYKDKDGKEVTIKEYKIELIELKSPRFVKEGDTWKMIKTHFVVETQTKEERANKVDQNFIGDGFVFEEKGLTKNDEVLKDLRDTHNKKYDEVHSPNDLSEDMPF